MKKTKRVLSTVAENAQLAVDVGNRLVPGVSRLQRVSVAQVRSRTRAGTGSVVTSCALLGGLSDGIKCAIPYQKRQSNPKLSGTYLYLKYVLHRGTALGFTMSSLFFFSIKMLLCPLTVSIGLHAKGCRDGCSRGPQSRGCVPVRVQACQKPGRTAGDDLECNMLE